jgi:hypothetical protein
MRLSIAIPWMIAAGLALTACSKEPTPAAASATPVVDSGTSDAGTGITVGGREPSADDLTWIKKWTVGPMYVGADVNGNETLDEDDGFLAARALQGATDLPCLRAADIDFNGRITQNDVAFITDARGAEDLHLFVSPHMECKAFSRVASREVGVPGETVPLVLLGDLIAQPGGSAHVAVESGPGKLVPLDATGRHFTVAVDAAAKDGEDIEVRIYVGFDPATRVPPEPAPDSAERVYVYAITVQVPHAP